jgi:hypothetical protein
VFGGQRGSPVCQNRPVHTGDAEEQALFERLEREFAEVKVPRARAARPRHHRDHRLLPRLRFLLTLTVLVFLAFWSLGHTDSGRSLVAPAAAWLNKAAPDGEYQFLREGTTGPVRWSSCRPIRVVVNDELRPIEAWDVVERGIAAVAETSGLTMEVVGRTDEAPSDNRPAEQPRYGIGWAPVLVAWTTPEADPGLQGNTVGLGGATSVTDANGVTRYVTGQITLDARQIEGILSRPGGDAETQAIVMHEVSHVLGLDHVDSPWEVMAEGDGAVELGPGDNAGLRVAGTGPCL